MAQLNRTFKTALLRLCPSGARLRLLEAWPNLRKAAPAGIEVLYEHYLGDIRVSIDTRYRVERIQWSGEYEPPLMRFLRRQQTAGWVALDVGANVGAVALALAKYCGPAGKVYAFEPGARNLERLRENFRLNPPLAARCEILGLGVGEQCGELWWKEEAGNPGNGLLRPEGTHRVAVTTLDAFFAQHPAGRIDFVKIDVEGMELAAMRGAAALLERFRPLLYFETLPRYLRASRGVRFAEIEELLVGRLGYRLYRLSSAGELIRLRAGSHGGYTVAVHPGNHPKQDRP